MLYSGGEFGFADIMTVSVLIMVCMLVKRVLTSFAGYVFSFEKEARTWQEQNVYMWFALSLIMTVVSAVAVYIPMQTGAVAVYLSLAVVYILAVIVKFVRVFIAKSPFSALYIIMYVLTLEVLPLALMVKGAEMLTA